MQPLDFDPWHRAARNQGLMRCYSSSKLREAPLAASFIAVPLYDNLTEDLYHQNALRLIAAAADSNDSPSRRITAAVARYI